MGTVPAVTHPSLGATVGFLDELCPFRLSLGGLRIARSRERSPAWHSELMERHPLWGGGGETWGEITISTNSSRQLEKQQGLETSPGGESQAGPGTMSRWHRHLPVQRVLNAGSPRISSMLVFGVVESKHCQTSRCLKQHQASAVSQKIHTLHAHCC